MIVLTATMRWFWKLKAALLSALGGKTEQQSSSQGTPAPCASPSNSAFVLPAGQTVARTCKNSSLDVVTKAPTPTSFEFRFGEQVEPTLSVNWLEHLYPHEADYGVQLAALRHFLLNPPEGVGVIKPTKNNRLAVLHVDAIRAGDEELSKMVVLECLHQPQAAGDPHSGVRPEPGLEAWPLQKDDPIHLAVQVFLFQNMCHYEPGVLEA